jgi:hypothetical protein
VCFRRKGWDVRGRREDEEMKSIYAENSVSLWRIYVVSIVAYGRDLKVGKVLPRRGLHDVVGGREIGWPRRVRASISPIENII